ncbi:putative HTH-type transcriptional regulator YusT [Ktedonobacter sp. SOSP1-52]|uniref:LysR family transcriptional regulator n=1 Tax=Ktedonobacter sp. SOSP1-52 TaxID=2778366 RepID=UPI0019164633|nr:LysR family transcriptional regulator [Ktedonobacter sp. SOSP1-52]GHO70536.1 putative HTH-type transcriptional regulator YusT [Ktedonobacter sp. SOSP1-52]
MELRYLATFQTIVREGSFIKAAETLSYAPSTITLHVQHLESELGFKLFVRQGKQIQLSTAGQALYEQADTLLQHARTLEQTMKEIVAGESGSLRIGVIEPAASVYFMPLLAEFCQEYPKMHVTLEVTSTRFICQRVATGKLEIGLCSPPPAELGLTFEPLFFEPIALLIPATHPLAELTHVTPADLQDQRLLLTGQYCAYRETIEHFFTQRGLNMRPCMEISSFDTLKQGVKAGIGIAVVPARAVTPAPEGTVLHPLAEFELRLPVGLVRSSQHYISRPVLEKLITKLRTQAE